MLIQSSLNVFNFFKTKSLNKTKNIITIKISLIEITINSEIPKALSVLINSLGEIKGIS